MKWPHKCLGGLFIILNVNIIYGDIFTSLGEMVNLVDTSEQVTKYLENILNEQHKSIEKASKYVEYYFIFKL